jgi:hypothetical protein
MGKSRDTANLTSKINLFSDITNDRVGVGNATPGEKLDVSGNIRLGTQANKATITYATNTARTLTIPNVGGNRTFAFIDQVQTFSGNQTFANDVNVSGVLTASTANVSNTISITGNTPFYRNVATINTNYNIGSTFNEMSIGPITIANGVTVTIESDGQWAIL